MKTVKIQRLVCLVLTLIWLGPAQAGFTDNGDGTVTDNVTGLMWDQCAWGLSGANCATGTASSHNWSAALGVAVTANAANGGAGYKNHNDWRLPNRTELVSLVNYATVNPAIDGLAFPNTPVSGFWSSTGFALDPAGAWLVDFYSGGSFGFDLSSSCLVRLVRSGQSFGAFDALAPALSPVAQTVSGTVGAAISPSTAFTPSGFSGTVGYTISPTLPAGLAMDANSGTISGTPTTAQSFANYTVTGTGSVSGSATATVQITITLTPAPNPIPTLSEWVQSMMIFLLIVTAGFYGWRMKPR